MMPPQMMPPQMMPPQMMPPQMMPPQMMPPQMMPRQLQFRVGEVFAFKKLRPSVYSRNPIDRLTPYYTPVQAIDT
jgi:hypothetical protein